MVEIEVRALRPEELESWFDVASRLSGQPRSRFVNSWEGDPHRMQGGIVIAKEGEQILGGLRIFAREIYLGGVPVMVGGVGDLYAEQPEEELTATLVDEAIRFMGRRSMAASLIFSPDPQRYAAHGWKPVPMEMVLSRLPVDAGEEPYDSAPANPRDPAEARQMQVIYEGLARHHQGAVKRADLSYWTGWLSDQWELALIGRKNGRPAGYLAAHWAAPDELHVQDFAALPGEATDLFQALVRAMARERSLESVRVKYPLALQLDLEVEERQVDPTPMYRVIQPPLLPLPSARALDEMLRGECSTHLIWPADWF
ncbi:MAG: GNAT family N-acetyltransferase [Bacillota bacterium]